MRALVAALVFALVPAAIAHADVGVLPTVVQGFDAGIADKTRAQVDKNVEVTLDRRVVKLQPKCALRGPQAAQCVAQTIAESGGAVDEAVQVELTRVEPGRSEMTLHIYSLAGAGAEEEKLTTVIEDRDAIDATTAMLRKAFDPKRYRGTVEIKGAPSGAELLVDGLRIEEPRAHLWAGKHVLEVVEGGRVVHAVPFDVAFEKVSEVHVPAPGAAAAAGPQAPLFASATTAITGGATLIGATVWLLFALNQHDSWTSRALGNDFPTKAEDPRCIELGCAEEQQGWSEGYGPEDEKGIGQGARFVMVAVSNENVELWDAGLWGAFGLVATGALTTAAGVAGVVLFWPGE